MNTKEKAARIVTDLRAMGVIDRTKDTGTLILDCLARHVPGAEGTLAALHRGRVSGDHLRSVVAGRSEPRADTSHAPPPARRTEDTSMTTNPTIPTTIPAPASTQDEPLDPLTSILDLAAEHLTGAGYDVDTHPEQILNFLLGLAVNVRLQGLRDVEGLSREQAVAKMRATFEMSLAQGAKEVFK